MGLATVIISFFSANGEVYVGEFKDNQRNGQGTYTYANGEVYVGEFKDNQRNGQGTYAVANGDVYVGEYKDDQRNGQGTYTYVSGHVYVGEFKRGLRSGQGTLSLADGGIQEGVWTNGQLSDSVSRRTNSNSVNRSSQSSSSRINRNKSSCSSYGFTPNTDGHAQCVMYISEGISGQSESQIAFAMKQAARIQQQQNREIVAMRLEQQRYLAEVERQRQLNASLGLMQLGLAILTGQQPSAAAPIIPPPRNYSAFRTCRYSYGRDTGYYSIPSNQICPLNWRADGMTGFLTR